MRLFEGGGGAARSRSIGLGLALCRAEAAFASSFRVSPVQVNLTPTSPTALLTLGNDSNDVLRFQLSAFAWDAGRHAAGCGWPDRRCRLLPHDADGEPGRRAQDPRRVDRRSGEIEKTYRIFVEELPPGPGVRRNAWKAPRSAC